MSDIVEAKRKLPLPLLMQQLGLGEHAKKSARAVRSMMINIIPFPSFRRLTTYGAGSVIRVVVTAMKSTLSRVTRTFLGATR